MPSSSKIAAWCGKNKQLGAHKNRIFTHFLANFKVNGRL